MAKCGCANSTVCPCVLSAGSNVTISGTGQAGDPWVVNANATPVTVSDTATVDLTLTGVDISGVVKLEPTGNLITTTANGLLVSCATITAMCNFQPKLVAGNGINPTQFAAGTVATCLSTDAGNQLTFGTDGCLFVTAAAMGVVTTADTQSVNLSPGTAPLTADVIRDPAAGNVLTIGPAGVLVDVITGCGLSGEGTAASPLVVHTTGSSPYSTSCGGKVYCETASGKLVVDPEKFFLDTYNVNHVIGNGTALGPNISIDDPALPQVGTPTEIPFGPIETFSITNPSNCRSMAVRIEVGISHYQLRAQGAGRTNFLVGSRLQASGGIAFAPTFGQNHQIWAHDGSDADADSGWDTTSSDYIATLFTLAPGGVVNFSLQATARIINYTNDSTTIGDLQIFTRVTGYSI